MVLLKLLAQILVGRIMRMARRKMASFESVDNAFDFVWSSRHMGRSILLCQVRSEIASFPGMASGFATYALSLVLATLLGLVSSGSRRWLLCQAQWCTPYCCICPVGGGACMTFLGSSRAPFSALRVRLIAVHPADLSDVWAHELGVLYLYSS